MPVHRPQAAWLDRDQRICDRFRLVLSAIRTVPLFVSWFGCISESLNTKGLGGFPAADAICASTVANGGAGILL
jgi:hypothetical protein